MRVKVVAVQFHVRAVVREYFTKFMNRDIVPDTDRASWIRDREFMGEVFGW